MNFFSLISAFVLLIALASYSLFNKRILSEKTSKSYIGHQQAIRLSQNAYEKQLFKTIKLQPKKKKLPPTPKKTEKKKRPFAYHQAGRLNVFELFEKGKKEHPIKYELFAKLLRTLYSHHSFFKKANNHLEYQLIDQMLSAAKKRLKEPSDSSPKQVILETLQLSDSSLQEILYRILKGTKHYHFEEKKGIAPLYDFITCASNEKPKISLPFASKEMLITLFDKKIAMKIILAQEGKDGYEPITKQKLENILAQTSDCSFNQNIWPFIHFVQTPKEAIQSYAIGKDPHTNIVIKKKLPTW